MRTLIHIAILLSAGMLLVMGCERPISIQEFEEIERQGANPVIGETLFVEIGTPWTGFNRPTDIIVGYEPLIYVADTDNDRVLMLDLGGRLVGASSPIRKPVALGQDRRLQLLVIAEFDTLDSSSGSLLTYSALYRMDLVALGHNISNGTFNRVYFEAARPLTIDGGNRVGREFTGVGIRGDNSFYLTRIGPQNSSLVDPDNAVMVFTRTDSLIPRELWPDLVPVGTGLRAASSLSAIAAFQRGTDFIYTVTEPSVVFKVQWISFQTIGDFFGWESKFSPSDPGVDYLRPGWFSRPEGIAIDASGNFYVVDAERDSLYRFDRVGTERFSFGGQGSGTRQFNQPHGIAVYNRTLYIADTGNSRIVRYRLSTDVR